MTPVRPEPMAGRRSWSVAALFVLPYLVLMLSWVFAQPPAVGPDETSHLVKAIGMAEFDIGTQYTGTAGGSGLGAQRNRSISRVIPVPANLVPNGFNCELTRSTVSAGCLPPQHPVTATDTKYLTDPLGSYPPFLYPPIGWAARLGSTATQAYLLGRVFCALACSSLLLLGSAHLVRWLGSRALLGAFLGLTPTLVFCGSIVSTSGIEICAAFATAGIVVAGLRRPESLQEPGSQLLLGGVGATLILSRQLGVVTFALLMLLLLIRLGPRFFLRLLATRRPALLASVGVLVLAALAIVVWERRYDRPSHVGSAVSAAAFGQFTDTSYGLLRSGVALFGWLDTNIPNWFVGLWVIAFVVLVGTAALLGSRADRWTLVLWAGLVVAVAYFTYATVFYPVGASLQGRHILAVFVLLPVLAGVVVVEKLTAVDAAVTRRMFRIMAVLVPVLQFVSFYLNGRRYAVGSTGPVWFLPDAQWRPPLGWTIWLVTGTLACGALGWRILSAGRNDEVPTPPLEPAQTIEGIPAGVER